MAYTITAYEGTPLEGFPIGEAYEMLEATFLARDEFIDNAACEVVTVSNGKDIVYVIDRLGGSGSVARRDMKPLTCLEEARAMVRRNR